MAITSAITRKFDNGYVQVEIGEQNREPHYYKLPEEKADEFQNEYKKNSKKMNWVSAGIILTAIIATIFPVSYFTTKKVNNATVKNVLDICAGLISGSASMLLCNKLEANSHNKLLKKYNAEIVDKSDFGLKLN